MFPFGSVPLPGAFVLGFHPARALGKRARLDLADAMLVELSLVLGPAAVELAPDGPRSFDAFRLALRAAGVPAEMARKLAGPAAVEALAIELARANLTGGEACEENARELLVRAGVDRRRALEIATWFLRASAPEGSASGRPDRRLRAFAAAAAAGVAVAFGRRATAPRARRVREFLEAEAKSAPPALLSFLALREAERLAAEARRGKGAR